LSETHFECGCPGWARVSTQDCDIEQSLHRVSIHSLPQPLLLDLSVARPFGTDEKLGSARIVRGFVEQFVDVGFRSPTLTSIVFVQSFCALATAR
jgi:hypothetical protein